MLRELNSYAGLFAKVKVMERNLLCKKDYEELIKKQSVSDVAEYLKNNTEYKSAFSDLDTSKIHRGQLEQILQKSKEQELVKLIGFLSDGDRRFLETYITKREINIIKNVLRYIVNDSKIKRDIIINPYFEKKYSFNIMKLIDAKTAEEFKSILKDTVYETILEPAVSENGDIDVFRAEMMLDAYFYKMQWKAIGKYVSKSNRESVLKTAGTNIDMLNILWILRAKKYFDIPSGLIITYIIPEHYRIKKETLINMANAPNIQSAENLLLGTPYENLKLSNDFYAEKLYDETILKIVKHQAKANPFSVMSALNYIYEKDNETRNIIKITESIRYNIDKSEISNFLTGLGGEINGG